MIRLRTYLARERQRVVDPADLESTYFAVDPATKPVFEHEGVRVWVSGPDECQVEGSSGGRGLHLVESGTNLLPRARGLEILRAPRAGYPWVHSLDWRWGAGEYLDRDRVGEVFDRASRITPWVAGAEGPVGLLHLAFLLWYHNGAMANGAEWVVSDCTDEQIAVFVAAAIYLGLDEVADLIGRLDPDSDLSDEYDDLSSAFGDAALIFDAVRCKLVEAPADWG
ncbi:hypothetical protein [Actinoplanes sp. HUAS TT8]|uniref:hypothetical protein n=1 Tax=Actinoplanes sp. HUAS TT8 TaxID=3447453 RepID=UPI003F5285FC